MFFVWAYIVAGVVASPLLAVITLLHPRLRSHARERLGYPPAQVEPGAVWFHAASLGERGVVDALLPELRLAEPGLRVIVSCTSDSAREQEGAADAVICLPLDVLPWVLRWLDRVRPRGLILVEAELWPALLTGCRMRGIPVIRLAPREGPGMARLRRLPGVAEALLSGLGVVHPEVDLKSLAPRPARAFSWPGEAVIAGSTHEGEEAAVLDAWSKLDPPPILVLAPRERSRFDEVADLLERRGVRWVRRSAVVEVVSPGTQVVLLDSLGELSGLYPAAAAAFIGGTFVERVGGHSPAEAASAGCRLVRGPFVSANAPGWAGVDAEVAATPANLGDALRRALARPRGAPTARPSLAGVIASLRPILGAPTPPERSLRPALWPLAMLWLAAARLRPTPLKRAAIPVISVGGLTAGGSGKTPVAAWIAARVPGSVVVSRGYGRRGGGEVRTAGSAAELGDELAMLERRGQAVASSPDRLAAIAVAAKAGAKVAILDDGLQARSVGRDLEIIVIDARWPDGGGPIPVGTRRVPRSWLTKADIVWCNHGAPPAWVRREARPDATFVFAHYEACAWRHRGATRPLDALPKRPCVAIAGIARPEGFFRLVRELGVPLEETLSFADHHAFSWRDLQAIEAWKDDYNVIVTEKDAARLPADFGVWALVIEPVIDEGEAALMSRLAAFGAGP
ncbi:hypothetical protein LBMAG42_28420 [Deltaproteobacteria bacterium]|nr:hypothetical protein LBMAG42_28420 [Deltaproteobacteria bacterium]